MEEGFIPPIAIAGDAAELVPLDFGRAVEFVPPAAARLVPAVLVTGRPFVARDTLKRICFLPMPLDSPAPISRIVGGGGVPAFVTDWETFVSDCADKLFVSDVVSDNVEFVPDAAMFVSPDEIDSVIFVFTEVVDGEAFVAGALCELLVASTGTETGGGRFVSGFSAFCSDVCAGEFDPCV